MGLRTHPSQRQRRLGVELRRLRDAAGITAAEAGRHVDLSGAHLGHVESGRTPIPADKLRQLLDVYGVVSETFKQGLIDWSMAPKGWWHAHRRHASSAACDLAEAEALSAYINGFEPMHVPGLLQTPEYVSAIIRGTFPDASQQFVDQGLAFRMARQEALNKGPTPYHAIIHEGAFHMRFVSTEVMRRQIIHLLEIADLSYVTVQVIPFRTVGVLPAVGSPFVAFGNAEPALESVYLEHDAGCVFLNEAQHTARYEDIFQRMSSMALPAITPAGERPSYGTRDSFSLLQYLLYSL